MDALEGLGLLRTLGLTLTAEAGRLIVQPAELLDDDLRWLIRNHRDEIFQIVTRPLPTKPSEAPFVGFVGPAPGGVAILSPSGLWYFTPPLGSPNSPGEATASRGEARKPSTPADFEVEF